MELIFIRHGQGEHTLNIPQSLHKGDPALTSNGLLQAKGLAKEFPLSEDDILIVSPLRRNSTNSSILE
ncbi:histidine phosphatase family protein [Metabacillus litoralis]|uniref:histidine phosphatase family protein n=1 Tax=Metabacillus litoralis TaxID=152268 RepID=UPI001F014E22|nr:histidine phosphatase family protein [Metabacillus litoralis]